MERAAGALTRLKGGFGLMLGVTLRKVFPVLPMVTERSFVERVLTLAKSRLAGETVMDGAAADAPVPVRVTAPTLAPPEVAVSVPLAGPAAVGEKVMFAVAVPPLPATVKLVGVTANGAAVASETVADDVVVFLTVICLAELVVPLLTEPKSSEDGLRVMPPVAPPFPVMSTRKTSSATPQEVSGTVSPTRQVSPGRVRVFAT